MSDREEKFAIIGIGEIPSGWYPETTCIDQAVKVIKEAVLDAGISKDDIGALLIPPPLAGEKDEYHLSFSRIVEEMGLKGVKYNFQVAGWWASPMMAIQSAKGVIFNDTAEIAIVLQSQHFSSATEEDMRWFFQRNNLGFYREWEQPYGISYKSMVALITQRYMYETGLTPEQHASVIESLRKWAQLNPHARFRKDLTVEDVLNSEMESSPLHTGECGVFSDGATAFIVTSAEKAKSIAKKPPVYILGEGHAGPPYYSFVQKSDRDFTRLGVDRAAKMAIDDAGIKLEAVDIFELYAGYPIFYIMQIEEIGLCQRGEGGKYFMEGNADPGGKTPVSTNGGIQQGDTGIGVAMTPIIEGVCQLRGESGKRQVMDAKIALTTNFGNQMMDSHVTILGKEMP
ncbi:MAG: thiolase family protein [Deltaproteobacteria bacterium]|nr:thiolase family protein [Deltaproteobacteria bacterium]